ncbi:MAG TPA: class I SAM-dependent methyltransferase [Vicinamibacterales bacterium]|nr:class I SAM-dependent methyltransferase [Vicinamibacterales bacterium]
MSWDLYAPFYDWENARTLGRRDVPFWRRVVLAEKTTALELGCGTGRLLAPLARAGATMVGVDLSAQMIAAGRARLRRLPAAARPAIVRGDIRALPFRPGTFGVVLASYGMLQSLVTDDDLERTLAEAARVLPRRGLFGVDLVPDLPRWQEYGSRARLSGRTRGGGKVTLIESVRQHRRRGLTVFDEEFIVRKGREVTRRRFSLTFRTLPLPETIGRIERAGFHVESVLGDYRGGPWDDRADVWILLARRR